MARSSRSTATPARWRCGATRRCSASAAPSAWEARPTTVATTSCATNSSAASSERLAPFRHASRYRYSLTCKNAPHRRAFEHAVLVRRVCLQLAHRQTRPLAPAMEDKRIRIHRREPLEEPVATSEEGVDLAQMVEEDRPR